MSDLQGRPDDFASLLPGRNMEPLEDRQIRQVMNTFLDFDDEVPVKYDPNRPTAHRVVEEDGDVEGRVYFSADIFPGRGVMDPNAALSMKAAVAHEICHHHRWVNGTELPYGDLTELDEAQTSLDALLRFEAKLSNHDRAQLARDALRRLQRLAIELDER